MVRALLGGAVASIGSVLVVLLMVTGFWPGSGNLLHLPPPGQAGGGSQGPQPSQGGAMRSVGGPVHNCPGPQGVHQEGFLLLCLNFNEQVFGVAHHDSPVPCFDSTGNCLDPTDPAWPNKGDAGVALAGRIPFWMPATGNGATAVKSALNFGPERGGSITVSVPAGKYGDMYLIAAAGNGPGPVDISFHDANGATQHTTQQFDDWCVASVGGSPAGVVAVQPQGRWDNHGNPTTPGCGVLEYGVRIPNSSQTLTSITFRNDPSNQQTFEPNILAITLK